VQTHVDCDHSSGVLEWFGELRQQQVAARSAVAAPEAWWHNAFGQTVGAGMESDLQRVLTSAGPAAAAMENTRSLLQAIAEGHQLRLNAVALGIPINPGFGDGVVRTGQGVPPLSSGLSVHVVGPSQETIDDLREEWIAWLDERSASTDAKDAYAAATADRSLPNFSSIMLLVEADGRSILLTGDGRGDHLLQGLAAADLLDVDSALHVDVLKLPHHGSARNISRAFFETVTADTYIVSANGRHGHPDLATLIWLVEAAAAQEREILIVASNSTDTLDQLLAEYPPDEYGYRLSIMDRGVHFMTVELEE